MKSYLCEDAEPVMELSFACGSNVWNCARHLKHSLGANVVRVTDQCLTIAHLCWKYIAHWVAEVWVLVDSLIFCVGAVVPQRFITVPGFTFCELSSIILIFFLTMQTSYPRRGRWNKFGRQEVESLRARLENRRLNTCIVFQFGQNLDHMQSHRFVKKVFWIKSMKRGSDWHLLIW